MLFGLEKYIYLKNIAGLLPMCYFSASISTLAEMTQWTNEVSLKLDYQPVQLCVSLSSFSLTSMFF